MGKDVETRGPWPGRERTAEIPLGGRGVVGECVASWAREAAPATPHLACAAPEQHRVLLLRDATASVHCHSEAAVGCRRGLRPSEDDDFRCRGPWERKTTVAWRAPRALPPQSAFLEPSRWFLFWVFSQFSDFPFSYRLKSDSTRVFLF